MMTTPPDSGQLTAAQRRALERAQFFFLHGDDLAKIENFKEEIVNTHLRAEEREENYNEYGMLGGALTALRSVLGDVIAELSTVSFLPTAKRVVTLYNIQDFYEARTRTAKKGRGQSKDTKSPSEILVHFIENDLPNLPAVLIIIAPEDYEKRRRVLPTDPVFASAKRQGSAYCFREVGPQFAFFDALFARNSAQAIRLWRDWQERVGGSPRPYFALISQLRLLIQAKMVASRIYERRGVRFEEFVEKMLPADEDLNVMRLSPDWRREKLMRASANFTLQELVTAYEKLEPLAKYAVPLASDPFVPDRQLLAELWILEFCAREENQ
ncbi:MAG: hypothetical protein N2Z21_07905 [Candidatus Sumerlaeaceae bacterium]|nr:hypothetical protein [Candidatus Sumerlaeaceae bacterium]